MQTRNLCVACGFFALVYSSPWGASWGRAENAPQTSRAQDGKDTEKNGLHLLALGTEKPAIYQAAQHGTGCSLAPGMLGMCQKRAGHSRKLGWGKQVAQPPSLLSQVYRFMVYQTRASLPSLLPILWLDGQKIW